MLRAAPLTVIVGSFGGVENRFELSIGRIAQRTARCDQGRIEARAGRGTSSIRPGEKSVSTFPGLEAIADPKFPLKNVIELFCEVASGASPSEPSTDGRKLRIPT